MEEQFENELRENGAGVDTAVKRFMGNKALYKKFLMKFKEDRSCQAIAEHIGARDYEEAFNAAHSLKGVAGNLGLDPVYEGASKITELLRGKSPEEVDRGAVEAAAEDLGKACGIFRTIIMKYE